MLYIVVWCVYIRNVLISLECSTYEEQIEQNGYYCLGSLFLGILEFSGFVEGDESSIRDGIDGFESIVFLGIILLWWGYSECYVSVF